jgi:hypothetical protein
MSVRNAANASEIRSGRRAFASSTRDRQATQPQHQRRGPHEGSKVLCMGVTLHLDPSTLSRMENAGVKQVGGATRNLHRVLDALGNAGVELLPSAGAPRPRALALSACRERMRLRGRVQN